ncbi:two component Fis family sigma54 specific transcriptional regulator [Geothermobacter ehrlichii]|uniref:Two component Fis family sigma54 specific transcriptional regulator n=1 Tax=Geothermobacter ehrlichii TaxID=213224 RepID=A0A5D3WQR0_9BACT|nr:sigma-54 dependent transcriptional regulator [Geothermobacter ehrlichii]TYO99928.1 two component Fis family sigma54 specific transcriptional regulator [Geothermobacter ehrlichii]
MMRVLVVDDDSGMRQMLRLMLEKNGYEVEEAGDGREAIALLAQRRCPLVLCDVRMPDVDGLAFLDLLEQEEVSATVIMMSAYGSIETAIECLKRGAYDYISKPFKTDEVVLTLKKAEERLRLLRENALLRAQISAPRLPDIIYRSRTMAELMDLVRRAAASDSPVLVTGETGTGKELVARALHDAGPRREGPFVPVNCSAIASGLLESELFGHARGAFTGADRARDGLFLAADGGTLFLDEIGELPLELQPKLLRVLQEKEVRRVGDAKARPVNVRVVAATARNLWKEVEAGRFRDDLYFRLAVVELAIPPLRERPDDIPVLARFFLERHAAREGRPTPELTGDAMALLQSYSWPGNVRELENFMARILIFCRGSRIGRDDMPWDLRRSDRSRENDFSLKKATERLEKEYIRKALAATGGNRTKAARLLEISLRALMYKIKDHGLGGDEKNAS